MATEASPFPARAERGRAEGRRLRRDVGFLGLMFASLGSIIGSGWLFGALYAAQIAGPAALVSWVAGGVAVMLLALVHAELGGMFPVAGGSARFPHYAFGNLVGFGVGWIAWLGAVTTAPIEVEASLQYFTHYVGWFTKTSAGTTVLTWPGWFVAIGLMALFSVVNVLGVRWLARTNTYIMWWKVAIPFLAVFTLLALSFHTSNFSAGGGFAPFGAYGIMSAVSTGGVIFAYLGFEQAVQLGGETSNPGRNIPLAVITSMIIGIVLYILLQIAFIGALHPSNLTHGWSAITFAQSAGPFAGLATLVGASWLAILLYIDAGVSPGGTGLLYTGTSSRLSYALGRQGFIPVVFGWLNDRGVPWVSILLSFVAGVVLFLPFPGWQQLVGFVTSATVLMYASAPLSLAALRRQEPDRERPYRLPAAAVIAPVSFIVANLIIYFTGWVTDWKLFIGVGIGFALLAISHLTNPGGRVPRLDWRGFGWMPLWIAGMAILSLLGRFDHGNYILPRWWDLVIVAAFSLVIYQVAIRLRLAPDETREHIGDVAAEAEEEKRELGAAVSPV